MIKVILSQARPQAGTGILRRKASSLSIAPGKSCLSESGPPRPYPVLDFRFLFAYDSVSFQGPMVRHHELINRVNAHGATRRPNSVDIARPGIHHSLRLSRNAATLALLPSENLA